MTHAPCPFEPPSRPLRGVTGPIWRHHQIGDPQKHDNRRRDYWKRRTCTSLPPRYPTGLPHSVFWQLWMNQRTDFAEIFFCDLLRYLPFDPRQKMDFWKTLILGIATPLPPHFFWGYPTSTHKKFELKKSKNKGAGAKNPNGVLR